MPRLPRTGEALSARHFSEVIRVAEAARSGSAPGTRTTTGPLGTTRSPVRTPGLQPASSTARHPFQLFGPYLDGTDWKIGIFPGTLNGILPVDGLVTSTGGSPLTSATRLTLTTGAINVVLGVKTDLETRAILRLTVETIEDTTPVVDTGARTRIAYIPIALLDEPTPGVFRRLSQIATSHVSYFTAGTSDLVWRA